MDSSVAKGMPHEECVKVAVNIRPLITIEQMMGCTDCITVVPGEPQVQIGAHTFTYDQVHGNSGSPSSLIYEECVAPLVDSLFHGYNATVLAYGQTGSGKTYTMGTNYTGEANSWGIIPKVMENIFKKVESTQDNTEYLIRVSFIEIFKEEVFDLLEGFSSSFKPTPTRFPIQIRETTSGGITLAGVMEAEVKTKEEMASYLARGSLSRATGSTNMNSQSSRSHAIFTISMEIRRSGSCSGNGAINDEVGDDIVSAKLHLVDLAGSERAKRTGADGLRFKEGVHINRGLLALGNVISALGDEKKRKEGGHIPYRDSKLTRLLQDSLGGNSKTVMIACVSPADTNAEETINTLKYANRARNIQNKAVINRDPMASQMQRMRSQLEQLQAELLYCRTEGAPCEELQILRHKVSLLEASNTELRHELKERQINCEHLAQRALDTQVEKDKLLMKIESARNGKPWKEIDRDGDTKELDLVKNYASKVQELETELLRFQSLSSASRTRFIGCVDLDDEGIHSKDTSISTPHNCPSQYDDKALEDLGEDEDNEKEREHSTLQERLDKELQELDKRLEQKEEEMKRFSKVDTSVLKQHYEKKVLELEQEKKALQKEIEDLHYKLTHISSASDDGSQKLREDYLQKLNVLEAQVSELKRKQEAQSQLLRQKQKSDEASKRLQEEIQRIKAQKVQLQHKIKQESEQFRSWKASREKEVLQLKKEGRRNEYEMHKLLALNQRQKMVLQRKTEEASQATKRLKELLEVKKASARELSGAGSANGPGMQKALIHAIEHELEVTVRVHEVRAEYERQLEARAAMANEMAKLKDELEQFKLKNMSDCHQTMSPSAKNSRILALENMLVTSSSTLVSMASQLSEAEERERIFSGKGRWNQVRSLAEAKSIMNYLFNLASLSRCQVWDKEVVCREKDSLIKELKEKVVKLSALVRQLEAEKVEMHHWQNMQKLVTENCSNKIAGSGATLLSNSGEDVHSYVLRKAPRSSQSLNLRGDSVVSFDDMDTSESEHEMDSDSDFVTDGDVTDDEWIQSEKKMTKKRAKRAVHTINSAGIEIEACDLKEFDESINKVKILRHDMCCYCSRSSFCKTKKCECRSAGSPCGLSCGCTSIKCSNRGGNGREGLANLTPTEIPESERCDSSTNSGNADESIGLALKGAMLLQSALADLPSVPAEGVPAEGAKQRKPLSDIGNTPVNSNTSKPNRRKNWRKTAIQLVPIAPTISSHTQQGNNDNAPSRARDDIPLRLPRAMELPSIESNPLGGKNTNNMTDKNAGNKDNSHGIIPPKSPMPPKASDDKENCRL